MPVVWLLFMVLIIVLNVTSKQIKAQKDATTPAAQTQKAQATSKQPQRPQAAQPNRPAAKAVKPAAPVHQPKPLEAHMHTPGMGIEGVGSEGEDCCHDYMLKDLTALDGEAVPAMEGIKAPEAQALLQGVIFSEILGRRPALRYGRKQA